MKKIDPLSLETFNSHITCKPDRLIFVPSLIASIKAMYGENHRHYHTLFHLTDCLEKVLRILKIDYSQGYLARQNVYAALFFHDAVYIPGFPENEVLSAKLARSCLTKLGVNENYICDIERYILATRHDHAPEKEDEWLVTDIDLSSLAVPWEVFKGNAEKLAREHRAVCSRGEFIYGQKIFLKRFLARKIFGTYHFTKYEDLAKENIGRFMYVI